MSLSTDTGYNKLYWFHCRCWSWHNDYISKWASRNPASNSH